MNQQAIIQLAFDNAVPSPYDGTIPLLQNTKLGTPNDNQYNGRFGNVQISDQADRQSVIGTPVFGSLVIYGGRYIDTNTGNTISYPSISIDTVLMTITQVNNVVLTSIQGRDGEVIEYIGKGSFRINFKGGFFSNGNTRPAQQLNYFMQAIQTNQPLEVNSTFLNEWGITEIVPLDKSIPQVAGGYNYQLFEFNAIQNTPVILAQQTNVT